MPNTILTTNSAFGSRSRGDVGDVDGDGLNDLAVSAPGWDVPNLDGGAIFILFMHGNDTVRDYTILTSDAFGGLAALGWSNPPSFGWSFAVLPPRQAGNPVDLVISSLASESVAIARLAANASVIPGSVELIEDGVGGIPNGAIQTGSSFGLVSALGDLDGDGQADLGISATFDSTSGVSESGAVYIVFLNMGGAAEPVKSFVKLNYLTAGLNGVVQAGSQLNSAVPIGDLDGDGRVDLAMGARRDDTGGTDRGATYIAFMGGSVPSASPTPSPSPSPAAAGTIVSASKIADGTGGLPTDLLADGDSMRGASPLGDLDGDGVPDIVTHVLNDDDGATENGAAYVFFLHSNGAVKRF